MSAEHNHLEYDIRNVPSIRNYYTWLFSSTAVGAATCVALEYSRNSSIGNTLLGLLVGALSGIAVFASTEYTIQDFRNNM